MKGASMKQVANRMETRYFARGHVEWRCPECDARLVDLPGRDMVSCRTVGCALHGKSFARPEIKVALKPV